MVSLKMINVGSIHGKTNKKERSLPLGRIERSFLGDSEPPIRFL